MKKLLSSLLLLGLIIFNPLKIEAATRTIDSDATNWSSASSWVEGAVPLNTDDVVANASSASITIDTTTCVASTMVLTGYTGTMTFTAGQKLTVTTTVTFASGMTIAGTGTLQLSNSATITSAGKTFTGNLIFDAGVWILADSWVVTGSVIGQTSTNTFNGNTLTIGGSLTATRSILGTTNLVLNGTGILSCSTSSFSIANNININTAGTITIGTIFGFEDGTFTYTAGTVDASTNSSTLIISDSCTMNTNGISWYNIESSFINETITLGSNLSCTGSLTIHSGDSWISSGAYDISCGTLILQVGSTFSMVSSRTLSVSTSMFLEGINTDITTIKAVTTSTAFNLDYNGTAANCQVYEVTFTDVDASLSAQGIDNWYGGTLTRTTNITNRTSADIGGGGTTYYQGTSLFNGGLEE